MATDSPLSNLPEINSSQLELADLSYLVDFSETNPEIKSKKVTLESLRRFLGCRPFSSAIFSNNSYNASLGDKLQVLVDGGNLTLSLPSNPNTSSPNYINVPIEVLVINKSSPGYGLKIESATHKINGSLRGIFFNSGYGHLIIKYVDATEGWVVCTQISNEKLVTQATSAIITYTGNGTASRKLTIGFYAAWLLVKCTYSVGGGRSWRVITSTINTPNYLDQGSGGTNSDSNQFAAREIDGYRLGTSNEVNENNSTYAAFAFAENPYFKVIPYTGNGTSNTPIYHGIGKNIALCIIKALSATGDWTVYHHRMATTYNGQLLKLSNGDAVSNNTAVFSAIPTFEAIYLGNDALVNSNGVKYQMFLFAEQPSGSKFDTYTGNGNSNATVPVEVVCGFRPSMVVIKSSETGDWYSFDVVRGGVTTNWKYLKLNNGDLEPANSGIAGFYIDFTANGFKVYCNSSTVLDACNRSNRMYFYLAWA